MDEQQNSQKAPQLYYLKVSLNFLRVQYEFAKNIKPNTVYRFTLQKNGKIIDEMKEYIKARMIGGRILFEPSAILSVYPHDFDLFLDLQLWIKMYEKQENNEEKQIASHVIYPITYINKYKHFGRKYHKQEAELLNHLFLNQEILVHHSKSEIQNIVISLNNINHRGRDYHQAIMGPKKQSITLNKQNNKLVLEPSNLLHPLSQSHSSRFRTPLIKRRRGRQGKLRSSRKSQSVQSVQNDTDRKQQMRSKSTNFVSINRKISTNSEAVGTTKEALLSSTNKNNMKPKFKKIQSLHQSSYKNDGSQVSSDGFKIQILKEKLKEQMKNSLKRSKLSEQKDKITKQLKTKKVEEIVKVDRIEKVEKVKKPQKQREYTYLKNEKQPQQLFSIFQSSQESNRSSRVENNQNENSPQEMTFRQNKTSMQELSSIHINPIYSFQSYKPRTESGFLPNTRFPPPTQQTLFFTHFAQPSQIQASTIKKEFLDIRDKLFYIGFILISCFLIWNSLTPSRRV